MLKNSGEKVRGSFNADVDRITPRSIGAEVILPLLAALLAALFIAVGASAVVRLLGVVTEAIR